MHILKHNYWYKYLLINSYISALSSTLRNITFMHFPEPVIFEIPVYPRTQKYIRTKLRDKHGQPQPLLASPFGQGVSLHLWLTAQSQKVKMVVGYKRSGEKKPMHVDKSGRIIAPLEMTAALGLGIERFHKSRHQYLFNHQELEQFGTYVDFIIENELVCYCQAAPEVLPMIRIKEFMQLYDFDEQDFKEETLRVAYWRYRKNQSAYPFNVQLTHLDHFRPTHSPQLA